MSAHTPGPWKIEVRDSMRLVWSEQPDTAEAVATAWGDSRNPDANARLIAAAPDLLAALRRIADGHLGCGECSTAAPCFVCAALAKAEGKS